MKKISKIVLGSLVSIGLIGIEAFIFRDNLYKKPESLFYHYDHENYKFFDKHKNGELARVRMVEYPNLESPIKNLFEYVYVQYDITGQKFKSGNFETTDDKLVCVTHRGYSVERIENTKNVD